MQSIGVERSTLSFSLQTLLELEWIRRELPFSENSERRAIYRVADPFLTFWYRFVAPLASDLQFSKPAAVYASHVAPRLADYLGWRVFEEICGQMASAARKAAPRPHGPPNGQLLEPRRSDRNRPSLRNSITEPTSSANTSGARIA